MNRDPILFLVDGTAAAGWERLSRCLVYAAALQRRRRPTYVLGQLDPRSWSSAIRRTGTDWLEADGPAGSCDDATETIREVRRLNPAAIVVDAPDLAESYLAELGSTGALVVSIDHEATQRFPSELVVNPLLTPGVEEYDFCTNTQLLLGSRYALVRPEVRRVRPTRSQEPPTPFSAFIALGEDDVTGRSIEIAKLLAGVSRLERIDIAVRPEHPMLAEFQKLAEESQDRIKIALEPSQMMARVSRCHFAVTSGSSWSLELSCVGVPQVMIVLKESYLASAQRLEEEGVGVCLGMIDKMTPSALRQAVSTLINDPQERQAMSRCGRQLIDGRGPDRLVTALEVMLHPSRQLQQFNEAA